MYYDSILLAMNKGKQEMKESFKQRFYRSNHDSLDAACLDIIRSSYKAARKTSRCTFAKKGGTSAKRVAVCKYIAKFQMPAGTVVPYPRPRMATGPAFKQNRMGG